MDDLFLLAIAAGAADKIGNGIARFPAATDCQFHAGLVRTACLTSPNVGFHGLVFALLSDTAKVNAEISFLGVVFFALGFGQNPATAFSVTLLVFDALFVGHSVVFVVVFRQSQSQEVGAVSGIPRCPLS